MKFHDKDIISAIEDAENHTSGEIRVHIASFAHENVLEKAKHKFEKLGMTKTKLRNGILIYIAKRSHCFAIIGDTGIHERVHQEFWDEIRDVLQVHFKKGEFNEGLCEAIASCGQKLKQYFPSDDNDKNELDNTVSRD